MTTSVAVSVGLALAAIHGVDGLPMAARHQGGAVPMRPLLPARGGIVVAAAAVDGEEEPGRRHDADTCGRRAAMARSLGALGAWGAEAVGMPGSASAFWQFWTGAVLRTITAIDCRRRFRCRHRRHRRRCFYRYRRR